MAGLHHEQVGLEEAGRAPHRRPRETGAGRERSIVLVLDNVGYSVERKILSPDAVYQDIPRWDWTALPAALGASAARVYDIATVADLRAALANTQDTAVGHFLRVRLDRDDAPRLLLTLAAGINAANSRS